MPGSNWRPTAHADDRTDPFAEIAPPLSRDAALLESSKCLYCYDAPCTMACPTHIDVPSFIKKIASGNLRGSARVILDANPMGHSCARACPVEVMCEGACVLNDRDEEPIKIALLQRHATDFALEKRLRLFEPGVPTGRNVAIIGAGPAGLSCAQDLRRWGHAVSIFDSRDKPGGLNTYAIAEYKMRPPVALAEAEMILALGVDLRTGVLVGRDVTFASLEKSYDAICVAVGLGAGRTLGIPGESIDGVHEALAFIEHLKMNPYSATPVGRRVVVIGAGNTAIDAATQAKRLGAERVTIVYRRGEEDMPAYHYEYELAKNDGCEFRFLTIPKRIVGDSIVTGIECARAELSQPDAGGRRSPVEIPDSNHIIECDMVIKALGQLPRQDFAEAAGLRVEGGRFISTKPNVVVCGDCANGGAEIVNAAAEGKAAAATIHGLLKTFRRTGDKL
ncbi:MAG: NAD(P)-dependent oxidoreductase [Anaerolineae bacterium]|nr:NAD(P)-dependent oxidoreductase [Gemmatimonadaceae bacterium]